MLRIGLRRSFSNGILSGEAQQERAARLAQLFINDIFTGKYESLKVLFRKDILALREHDKHREQISKILEGSKNIKSPTKYKEKLDKMSVIELDADAIGLAIAEKTIKFVVELPANALMRNPDSFKKTFQKLRNIVNLSAWSYNVMMDENRIMGQVSPPLLNPTEVLDMMKQDQIQPDLLSIKIMLKRYKISVLDIIRLAEEHDIALDVECYIMIFEKLAVMDRCDEVERLLERMIESDLSLECDCIVDLKGKFSKSLCARLEVHLDRLAVDHLH
jgi:hypothetical protein